MNKEIQKKSENLDENKKENNTLFSTEDLKKLRDNAVSTIEEKIHHPELKEEALQEIRKSIAEIEAQLQRLDKDANDRRENLRNEARNKLNEIIGKERNFTSITVEYGTEKFIMQYNPPIKVGNYHLESDKAFKAVMLWKEELGLPEKAEIESKEFLNGKVNLKVVVNKNINEEEVIMINIDENSISQRVIDSENERKLSNAKALEEALMRWKNGESNISYGNPPKTFPPVGLNTKMLEYKFDKNEITIDLLFSLAMSEPLMSDDLKDCQGKLEYTIFNFGEDISSRRQIISKEMYIKNVPRDTSERVEIKNDVRLYTREYFVQVAQQRRKVIEITEYWPKSDKLKRISKMNDGVVIEESKYDRNGSLIEKRSTVKDIDSSEAVAVERPTTSPPKMVPLLDEYGKEVKDTQGKPIMVEETDKVLYLKGSDGKTREIKSFNKINGERKKLGLKPISSEEYLNDLAKKIKTPKEFMAFMNLMLKYRYDGEKDSESDNWQTPEQTIKRTDSHGNMLGDCEDWAFLIRRIREKQGHRGSVMWIPGHAEYIEIKRNKEGKFFATSYGTFGVDTNGYSLNGGQGFDTAEEALRSLQSKWAAKNSGNLSMGNGNLIIMNNSVKILDIEVSPLGNKALTSTVKIIDLPIQPID